MTRIVGAQIPGSRSSISLTISKGLIALLEPDGSPDRGEDQRDDTIDASGLTISPGLIDLQINGSNGSDFTTDPSSIWQVGTRLPEYGVTGFLPTIITAPAGAVEAAIEALAERPAGYLGAEPIGLHLEGPMISGLKPGAHTTELLRAPSLDLVRGWSRSNGIAMVTIAPELDGAERIVKALTEAGVIVSAGHTAATFVESAAGFAWGITSVTHLYNAMAPFDHREPGLIGALLQNSKVVAGIIADGIHSHPAAVAAAWKWLGPNRLALVTDAMAASAMADGNYHLGSINVTVANGRASDPTGRLAGSTLTLDQAVRNLSDFTGCTFEEALGAASTVPANLLGLHDRGHLSVGQRADLILVDEARTVVATMVGGEFAYEREGWRQ